jgi:hypothetical protein
MLRHFYFLRLPLSIRRPHILIPHFYEIKSKPSDESALIYDLEDHGNQRFSFFLINGVDTEPPFLKY